MSTADDQIQTCLNEGKSFLLDAGAGAGKTYSLVEALKYLRERHETTFLGSGQRLACITYTNVAKDEVIDRTGHHPAIRVSTIHDFLWDVVQPHQRAIKRALLELNASLEQTSARKVDGDALRQSLPSMRIVYSDRGSNYLEGRLHHDDLLSIARLMFEASPMLCRLVAARYPYILVDEYQDAAAAVMVVLSALLAANEGRIVIGLFGDKYQNIYHSGEHRGVGEVPTALSSRLVSIPKGDNRRCSKAIIALLNRMRTDIQQFAAADNLEGSAAYIRLAGDDAEAALERSRDFVARDLGWKLAARDEKVLFLTHKLIAKRAGHSNLLGVYDKRGQTRKDELLSGDDPVIAFFLTKVEPLIEMLETGRLGAALAVLRSGGFDIVAAGGKRASREALDALVATRAKGTVRDVLDHIRKTRLLSLPDILADRLDTVETTPLAAAQSVEAEEREAKDKAFFEGLFALPYSEVQAFREYFNKHTPFSTKHGVKGAEFDTVFVLLDDKGAGWNLYSFDKFLSGEDATRNAGRALRTRNLFYVCCSRAKRNLAVIDLGGRSATKEAAVEKLFGAAMCFDL